jgi:hypothetical protein
VTAKARLQVDRAELARFVDPTLEAHRAPSIARRSPSGQWARRPMAEAAGVDPLVVCPEAA